MYVLKALQYINPITYFEVSLIMSPSTMYLGEVTQKVSQCSWVGLDLAVQTLGRH